MFRFLLDKNGKGYAVHWTRRKKGEHVSLCFQERFRKTKVKGKKAFSQEFYRISLQDWEAMDIGQSLSQAAFEYQFKLRRHK